MRNSAKECAICHFRWMDQFYVEGRGTDLIEYQKERVAGSEMICYSCHNGIMVDSRERFWAKRGHRVNMVPSEKIYIPPDMPLGAKGELVCATCHTVHGVSDELRYLETIYLRHSNKSSEMCMMCHVTKTGGKERGNHPIHVTTLKVPKSIFDNYGRVGAKGDVICETCHTVHGTIDKNLLVLPDRIEESVFTSDLCEACHSKNPSLPDKGAGMGTHPVDIKPKEALPPLIWQGERKVAKGRDEIIICETCHWPHAAKPGSSIIAKLDDALICLDCHKTQRIIQASDHDLQLTDTNAVNIYGKTVKDSGVCSPCHIPHNAGEMKLWSRSLVNIYPQNGISPLCLSCHTKGGPAKLKQTGTFTHPVEKTLERIGGKTELPLYDRTGNKIEKGVVTCSTCHNPHKWDPSRDKNGPGLKVDGDSSNSFLRVADIPGSSLCITCHKDKEIVKNTEHDLLITAPMEKNSHDQTLQKGGVCSPCHVVHNGTSIKIWAKEVDKRDQPITGICSSCHKEKGCGEKKVIGDFTHPTEKEMVKLEDVDIKALFPQYDKSGKRVEEKGLITCSTCHDPHQWMPGNKTSAPGKNIEGDGRNSFLRFANNRESSLCISCHKQKEIILQTEHDLRLTAPKEKNILNFFVYESGVCSACHIPHLATGPRLFSKKLMPNDDPGNRLCIPCHTDKGCAKEKVITENTHPMPEKPKIFNKDLPLFDITGKKDMERGWLACLTCHEPHQWDPLAMKKGENLKIEGTGQNSFLRIVSAPEAELCKGCHKDQGLIVRTDHDISIIDPNVNQGTCAPCHKVHNGEKYRLWAIQLNILPIIQTATASTTRQGPIDLLCESCHIKGKMAEKKILSDGFSHPVNLSLSQKKMKTTLPLFTLPQLAPIDQRYDKEKGDLLTCETCHDVHKWSEGESPAMHTQNIEGTISDSFLRKTKEGPGYICVDCHEDKKYLVWSEHDLRLIDSNAQNLINQDVSTGGICSPCHAVHHSPKSKLLWCRSLEGETDFMLGTCVNCHQKDGAAKRDIFIGAHPSNFVYTGKILETLQLKEAILNISYPLYDKQGNKTPVGFVTCTTCHDPHQWDPVTKYYPEKKNIEGDPTNSFLRNKGPAFSICLDCHGFEALLKYKNYHQQSEWKEKYWRKQPPAQYDYRSGYIYQNMHY